MYNTSITIRTLAWSLGFLLSLPLPAQELFTVKAGVFRDVQSTDFAAIQDLGFVYDTKLGNSQSEVYVGQFSKREAGEQVTTTLKQRGFQNAQLIPLPPGDTAREDVHIQIAIHQQDQSITWAAYKDLGALHAISLDGAVKILTGPYPGPDAARAALPRLREAGFKDAFLKSAPATHLISIDRFETGLKQPLIPISYTERPAPTAEAAPVAIPTADTSAAIALTQSVAELQRVLKEGGYYTGAIDGDYGPNTTKAYAKAFAEQPGIRRFRALLESGVLPTPKLDTLLREWPSATLLVAVSEELAAGMGNEEWAGLLTGQRAQLFATTEPLNEVATVRTREWAETVLTNLADWAMDDPLHELPYNAFRLAFHSTQIRFEEYYRSRGLEEPAARALAIAALQNLTGAQLDRFL